MTIKQIIEKFKSSMKQVAEALNKSPLDLTRDEYIAVAIDNDFPRLNKEQLNAIGGFKDAKARYIKAEGNIKQPKVLIYDIETAPIIAYVWGLWKNDVALNQIKSDWHILSWSAKWLGDPPEKTMYMDQRNAKNIQDDSIILAEIWKLLDEADIVVTQNGKKFDQKKLNARFIINKFVPPSSYKHIDTLELAKRHFGFTSNRLGYLSEKLCTKYKKLEHGKFPGFKMWEECLKNNIEAWKEMEEYNKYDVLSLEELYTKLIPWDSSIDFNLFHDELVNVCKCGSMDFKKAGFYYSTAGKYQKFVCNKCGAEDRGSENLFSKTKRKHLRRKTR